MFLSILVSLVMTTPTKSNTFMWWALPVGSIMLMTKKMETSSYFNTDIMSLLLMFVTLWVFFLAIFSMELSKMGKLTIMLMFTVIEISFATHSHLMFYVLFEFSFILIFTFLMGWGKNSERLQASVYMLMFTLVFSLPFLVMLINLSSKSGMFFYFFTEEYKSLVWIFMLFVFMVKLPIFSFHIWLPKAHVEAPVVGSMILAGVLLKLGGYGMIRFMPTSKLTSLSNSIFFCLIFYLALVGCVLTSIMCTRHMDLKVMIAYSSVVHMSSMMLGLMFFNGWSSKGSLLMMVAHGFISPLMFYLMTYVYNLFHSRSLTTLKGILLYSPVFNMLWLFSCCLNLGVPPFMSFFSEMLIFSGLGLANLVDFFMMGLCCFLTGLYCILMYTSLSHGGSILKKPHTTSMKVLLISVCHLFFVFSFPAMSA